MDRVLEGVWEKSKGILRMFLGVKKKEKKFLGCKEVNNDGHFAFSKYKSLEKGTKVFQRGQIPYILPPRVIYCLYFDSRDIFGAKKIGTRW